MIVMILLGGLGVAAVGLFCLTIYAVSRQARDQRQQQPGLSGAETMVIMGGTDAGHVHTDCSAHTSVDCGGHGGH